MKTSLHLSSPTQKEDTLQYSLLIQIDSLLRILESIEKKGEEDEKPFLIRLSKRYRSELQAFQIRVESRIYDSSINWSNERANYDSLRNNIDSLRKQIFPEEDLKNEVSQKAEDILSQKDEENINSDSAPINQENGTNELMEGYYGNLFNKVYGIGNQVTTRAEKEEAARELRGKKIELEDYLKRALLIKDPSLIEKSRKELMQFTESIKSIKKRAEKSRLDSLDTGTTNFLKSLSNLQSGARSPEIASYLDLLYEKSANDENIRNTLPKRDIVYTKNTDLYLIVPGYREFCIIAEGTGNPSLQQFTVRYSEENSTEEKIVNIFIKRESLEIGQGIDVYSEKNGRPDTSNSKRIMIINYKESERKASIPQGKSGISNTVSGWWNKAKGLFGR